MRIGKVYLIDNKPVYITAGQYESNCRISNAWSGNYVLPDGSLGDKWSGYGRDYREVPAEVIVKVVLK